MFKRLEDEPVTAADDPKTPKPDGEPAPDTPEAECVCGCGLKDQTSNSVVTHYEING